MSGNLYLLCLATLLVSLLQGGHAARASLCPWAVPGVKKWSSASTWPNGTVPLSGNVTLPAGVIVYDITTSGHQFYNITVPATSQLVFDGTKNVTLETNFIYVQSGGYFYIGSQSCPYTAEATITFYGPRDTVTQVSGFAGNKGIINAGTLQFYGDPPQPTWTSVSATVPVGSTSFTVQDSLYKWMAGDTIFIASTDYSQELTEMFTIVSVVGQKITIDRPTKYLHWGANNQHAEVGILSRNILLQGDFSSDASQYGGHVLNFKKDALANVYGVEFTRMGQRGVLARYPFHYHNMSDQIGRGQSVEECSFHHNYQRCVTVHATSGVLLQNNVGFNVTGHCYFLEEGSETWNTYNHNLGANVNPGPMIPTDSTPAVFWITNPNNSFTNNVAVGGVFGFWFSLPLHPLGMSANETWVYPRLTPLNLFENNTAHSASNNGIFGDFCPTTYGVATPECTYTPLDPSSPYTDNSNIDNTDPAPALLSNIVSYKNRQYGIWFNAKFLTVDGALLMDNAIGCNLPRSSTLIQNSVFVGETDNIGTPGLTPFFNEYGRSRPQIWEASYNIHGFEGYDIEGNQMARNCTFINFATNSVRGAGAFSIRAGGENVLAPNDIFAEITLINSNAWIQEPSSVPRDGPNHVAMQDADGSLTGTYGSYIVSANPILTFASTCEQHAEWSGFYRCDPSQYGYSNLVVLNKATGQTNFSDSFSQIFRAAFIPFGHPEIMDNITGGPLGAPIHPSYMVNVFSRHGYVMQFPHPTPPKLQIDLHYASNQEWVVLAIPYPPHTTFSVTRSNGMVSSVNSLANLTSTTYYYDQLYQLLYLMIFVDSNAMENSTSFPANEYSAATYVVSASCGSACTVPGNLAIPPPYVSGEDNYRADLTGSFAGTNSPHEGKAFFTYNPNTKKMSYLIYHSIPRATVAILSNRTGGFFVFPVAQSPLRGGFLISWDKHNDLWNGNWTITISSDDGSQTIGGRLGCVGACVPPPTRRTSDYCTSILGEKVLYDDSKINQPWTSYTWLASTNYNYNSTVGCGVSSVLTTFKSWSGWAMAIGVCAPGSCKYSYQVPYMNTSQYSYFQFLAYSPSGPLINVPIAIRVLLGNTTQLGSDMPVLLSHIDNYVIENSWTLVKIPLSYLGLTGSEQLGTFTIVVNGAVNNLQIIFDKIRLVPGYGDTVTIAPAGQVSYYVQQYVASGKALLGISDPPTDTPASN